MRFRLSRVVSSAAYPSSGISQDKAGHVVSALARVGIVGIEAEFPRVGVVSIKELKDGIVQLSQRCRGEDINITIDSLEVLAESTQQIDTQPDMALVLDPDLGGLDVGINRKATPVSSSWHGRTSLRVGS